MSERVVRLGVLCDHALIGQDGKLSLLGIFRSISVSALPAQHPRMYLVAVLGLETGSHTVTIRPRDAEGRPSERGPELAVQSGGSGGDVNVMVELNNMQFSVYGEHAFDIVIDGETVGSIPVSIVQMPAPASGSRRPH